MRNPKQGGQPASPTVYDKVLQLCGALASFCSSLIQQLGGPSILANKDLLRNVGVGLAIAGVALDLIDTIYTLQNSADKGQAIAWALAALTAVTSIISWLSSSTLPKAVIGVLMAIGGVVDFLAASLEMASALYLQFGIWGQVAADASVTAATTAAEGDVGPAVTLLGWLGGNVITYVLGGIASGLASIGESLIALADK